MRLLRTPPRFVTRTMLTTFSSVVLILAAVFLVVTLIVRDRVRSVVIARLTTEQTMLSTLEQRRAHELQIQVETLAESPTVKAAMDTFPAEARTSDAEVHRQLIRTVQRELEDLANRIHPDIVAVVDTSGTVVATAGRRRADWPRVMPAGGPDTGEFIALALALDARDPYTAGHSERVSAISAAVGQRLGLDEDDLEVLRLGALLHDIGKIGISDDVLRKPGPLTPEEFETIKEHPTTGARILRSVPFLAPHLPIVELHHERPDGRGYPHGLLADEIPMHARIVHVADAFDAITSARAYRPARGAGEALQELWRFAGTQFDAEVVQALAVTIPTFRLEDHRFDPAVARAGRKPGVVAFPRG